MVKEIISERFDSISKTFNRILVYCKLIKKDFYVRLSEHLYGLLGMVCAISNMSRNKYIEYLLKILKILIQMDLKY